MEHCAIVPECIAPGWLKHRHVLLYEGHGCGSGAKALTELLQNLGGDIQHREVPIARVEQLVDEERRAAADVNDWVRWPYTGCTNELEGLCRVRLIPTHVSDGLAAVDLVQMGLPGVHLRTHHTVRVFTDRCACGRLPLRYFRPKRRHVHRQGHEHISSQRAGVAASTPHRA